MYGWSQLTDAGTTQTEMRSRLRTGEWERVRHGVYAPATDLTTADRHLRLTRATVPRLSDESVVSHFSAALLHGLPVPTTELARVWITRPGRRGHGRDKGCVRLHHGPLEVTDVVARYGLAMTSPARTAVDVAARVDFPTGVAVVDAALAKGVTRAELELALDGARGTTGIARARAVVGFADPRSGSVGESRSRALMKIHSVPIPELQHPITDADGLAAVVDFWWEQRPLAGEFDGKIKYTRGALPDNADPSEVVWREKRREDRIRRTRCEVERWIWVDLLRPQPWADRLNQRIRG